MGARPKTAKRCSAHAPCGRSNKPEGGFGSFRAVRPNSSLKLSANGMVYRVEGDQRKWRNGGCMTEFLRLHEGWSRARIKITPL
jgi:hypothetical protein